MSRSENKRARSRDRGTKIVPMESPQASLSVHPLHELIGRTTGLHATNMVTKSFTRLHLLDTRPENKEAIELARSLVEQLVLALNSSPKGPRVRMDTTGTADYVDLRVRAGMTDPMSGSDIIKGFREHCRRQVLETYDNTMVQKAIDDINDDLRALAQIRVDILLPDAPIQVVLTTGAEQAYAVDSYCLTSNKTMTIVLCYFQADRTKRTFWSAPKGVQDEVWKRLFQLNILDPLDAGVMYRKLTQERGMVSMSTLRVGGIDVFADRLATDPDWLYDLWDTYESAHGGSLMLPIIFDDQNGQPYALMPLMDAEKLKNLELYNRQQRLQVAGSSSQTGTVIKPVVPFWATYIVPLTMGDGKSNCAYICSTPQGPEFSLGSFQTTKSTLAVGSRKHVPASELRLDVDSGAGSGSPFSQGQAVRVTEVGARMAPGYNLNAVTAVDLGRDATFVGSTYEVDRLPFSTIHTLAHNLMTNEGLKQISNEFTGPVRDQAQIDALPLRAMADQLRMAYAETLTARAKSSM